MRYLISVPFYADRIKDVNQAMDDIAEAIGVPYISVSSQFDEDEHKARGERIKFLHDKEYHK